MNLKVKSYVHVPEYTARAIDSYMRRSERALMSKRIRDYVITKEVKRYLLRFLEITLETKKRKTGRALLVSGSYGAGKSYFFLIASLLLDSSFDNEVYQLFHEKFKREKKLLGALDLLLKRKVNLLPVRIDLKAWFERPVDLDEIVIKSLREAIKEYTGKELPLVSEYEKAIEWLSDSDKANRLNEYLKKHELTLDRLVSGLRARDVNSLKIFKSAIEWIVEIYPYRLAPLPSIDEAVEMAVESVKPNFTGIALFIDEVQKYLEARRKLSWVEGDLGVLERVAELTDRFPLLSFVCFLDPGFAKEQGLPWADTLLKTIGRFEHPWWSLKYEELRRLLQEKIEFIEKEELYDILDKSKVAELLGKRAQKELKELYPLSPGTFDVLDDFVRAIGGAARSAFSFIAEGYKRVAEQPLIRDDGFPTVITGDQLYDHFKGQELSVKAKRVLETTDDLRNRIDKELKRYVKFLGICSTIGPLSMSDFKRSFLEEKENVKYAFEQLLKYSEVRHTKEGLRIVPLKVDIETKLKEIQIGSLVDEIATILTRGIGGTKFMPVQNVQRIIDVRFSPLEKAKELVHKTIPKGVDIRILVVLPPVTLSLNERLALMGKAGDRDLLVFLHDARPLDGLEEYIRTKRALQNKAVLEEDVETFLRSGEKRLKDLFRAENVSAFFRSKSLSYGSEALLTSPKLNQRFLRNILQGAFKRLYPEFLHVRPKMEILQKRETNQILREFVFAGEIFAKRKLAENIENITKPLGFAEKTDQNRWILVKPRRGHSGKFFREVMDYIRQGVRLNKFYDFLLSKGLTDPLIDVYLASLIALAEVSILEERSVEVENIRGQTEGIKEIETRLIPLEINRDSPKEFQGQIQVLLKDTMRTKYSIRPSQSLSSNSWLLFKEFLKTIGVEEEKLDEIEAGVSQRVLKKGLPEDRSYKLLKLLEEGTNQYLQALKQLEAALEEFTVKLKG